MNFTEEARELAISLGRDYPDVIERIAAALVATYERGKAEGQRITNEQIASIIDRFAHQFDKANLRNEGHIFHTMSGIAYIVAARIRTGEKP